MRKLISVIALVALGQAASAEEEKAMAEDPAAEMMKLMAKHTGTAEEHEKLNEFIGDWDVTISMKMPGAPPQSWEAEATTEWLIDGRWTSTRIEGEMFGQPYVSFSLHGYDTYAKAYVTASVSSMDNALNVTRGVKVDPTGKTIVEYGVLQEYLTGELYKPFRTVHKLDTKDHYTLEIWDMGIGKEGAVVLEFDFNRKGRDD